MTSYAEAAAYFKGVVDKNKELQAEVDRLTLENKRLVAESGQLELDKAELYDRAMNAENSLYNTIPCSH